LRKRGNGPNPIGSVARHRDDAMQIPRWKIAENPLAIPRRSQRESDVVTT